MALTVVQLFPLFLRTVPLSVELMMHGTTHTLLSQRKTPRKDVLFERVLKALLEPLRHALRDAKMDDATQLWDNLPLSPEELGCEPQQGGGEGAVSPAECGCRLW